MDAIPLQNRYFTFATNLNHNKQITYAKQTYYKQARAEEAFLLGCFLIGKYVCICPNRHTGTVTDKSGMPLIGVSVVEKGTTNGNVTDIDGKYSIKVEQGKTLVFSYIGYLTQEIEAKSSTLNVVMSEDNQLLDEVVVIGYGSMQRKDITSSITTVKAEDLNVGIMTSPGQMLQGKVPGLVVTGSSDPNASPTITLRGASTYVKRQWNLIISLMESPV